MRQTKQTILAFATLSPKKTGLLALACCSLGSAQELRRAVTTRRVESDATTPGASELLGLVAQCNPKVLSLNQEVEELSALYLRDGALPQKSQFDALHIAYASVFELDFLVSWNLRHIANIRRQEKVQGINLLNGYTKPIQLITPMEVSEHE